MNIEIGKKNKGTETKKELSNSLKEKIEITKSYIEGLNKNYNKK